MSRAARLINVPLHLLPATADETNYSQACCREQEHFRERYPLSCRRQQTFLNVNMLHAGDRDIGTMI